MKNLLLFLMIATTLFSSCKDEEVKPETEMPNGSNPTIISTEVFKEMTENKTATVTELEIDNQAGIAVMAVSCTKLPSMVIGDFNQYGNASFEVKTCDPNVYNMMFRINNFNTIEITVEEDAAVTGDQIDFLRMMEGHWRIEATRFEEERVWSFRMFSEEDPSKKWTFRIID